MPALSVVTPTGPFTVTEEDGAVTAAHWGGDFADKSPLLDEAAKQIAAYFAGDLEAFDVPLHVKASASQVRICDAIAAIAFGFTRTYGEIAEDLGLSAQAVGRGCGGNPIPLIIPCHRVVAADGLGGFSGRFGIETKVALLKHEGAASLLI